MARPSQQKFRDILEKLRRKVQGILAVVLARPNEIVDYLVVESALNIDTIASEYATLLQIAGRTVSEAGAGNLVEQIVVSETSIMIARNVSPGGFLILLCRNRDQIGRARYELKHAACEIQKRGVSN